MRESHIPRTRIEKANTTLIRWLILSLVTANLFVTLGHREAAITVGSVIIIAAMLLWLVTWKTEEIERGCQKIAERLGSPLE